MVNRKLQKVSVAALIISALPMATFIPVLLKITLPDGTRGIWSVANIVFVFVGLCLSIVCVRNRESRSVVNIVSTTISILWVLLMSGIAILALFLNFLQ